MYTQNEMKLSFPALSVNEGFARSACAAFCAQLNPTIAELADIRTALSEAVTNAIVHAYRSTSGFVEITMKVSSGNMLYIKVRDKGCGIADIKQAMEPLFTTAEAEERSGLGFSVMESFMDKLSVRSKPGKGTTVIMYKKMGSACNEQNK